MRKGFLKISNVDGWSIFCNISVERECRIAAASRTQDDRERWANEYPMLASKLPEIFIGTNIRRCVTQPLAPPPVRIGGLLEGADGDHGEPAPLVGGIHNRLDRCRAQRREMHSKNATIIVDD